MNIVQSIDGHKVLAQLAAGAPQFFMERTLAECVGHRYTLKYHSQRAAWARSAIMGGRAGLIPGDIIRSV